MSVSADPIRQSFFNRLAAIDDDMIYVSNKFPQDGMKSFTVDEKSGKFEVVYDKAKTASPTHSDKDWNSTVENLTIKVKEVVTGRIDAQNKSIRFDAGCVVATKGQGWLALNVSLTEFKISNGMINVSGKLGIFPESSQSLTRTVVMGAQINWA